MPKTMVIHELASKLGSMLLKRKLRCAVAESCTGGSLAAAITEIAGSSQWFDRGFVTYTNEAKEEILAVPHRVISTEGAVSEATVRAMAHGVIANSHAEVSVAISGIAGPAGGSTEKPVGTVWIAWAGNLQPTYSEGYFFEGDRRSIRQQAVCVALEGLIERCGEQKLTIDMPRYFFALWPEPETADALFQRGRDVCEPNQGHAVVAENLHMTLAYLGSIPADVLSLVKHIAARVHVTPFELSMTHANYWPHSHLRWLGVDIIPPELLRLVKCLTYGMIEAGLIPEKSPYTPHVTIVRKCTQSGSSEPIKPVQWVVSDFCLVQSLKSMGCSKYDVIQRWPFDLST